MQWFKDVIRQYNWDLSILNLTTTDKVLEYDHIYIMIYS